MSVMAIITALLPVIMSILQTIIKDGYLSDLLKLLFKPETPKEFIQNNLSEAVAEGNLVDLGRINQHILDTQGDSLLNKNELSNLQLLGDLK